MLFIFEVLLLLCGLYAIATGKLPQAVFGKKYRTEGLGERLIGLMLVVPMPTAFIVGEILAVLYGSEDAFVYRSIFEMVLLVLMLTAALVVNRRVRQPATP
ncbi:MAG: hypothetical protein H0T73_22395 [Ardenticatenales bacterium]|nr:hypothetical protein [Ardenticatenales bacterium]